MKMIFVLAVTSLAVGLTACNSGSGGGGSKDGSGGAQGSGATVSGAPGIWLAKEEAEELRATGRIESICAEVKQDPDYTVMNTRLIDESGVVYLYDPKVGKIEEMKMGVIDSSGKLNVSGFFKEDVGDAEFKVVVENDILKVTAYAQGNTIPMEYVRSSDDELTKYYLFQDSCRK